MGVFRPNRRNRSLDRSYDARVGAASAQIAGERFNNLGTARPLRLLQDGISRDQYPSQAISALSRAFSDECVSQRIRLPSGESINGFNMPAGNGVQRHGAGVMKLAVNDNSTGSAIFAATSKANALQAECIAKREYQRQASILLQRKSLSVYGYAYRHRDTNGRPMRRRKSADCCTGVVFRLRKPEANRRISLGYKLCLGFADRGA
jgi:hypothetical protein